MVWTLYSEVNKVENYRNISALSEKQFLLISEIRNLVQLQWIESFRSVISLGIGIEKAPIQQLGQQIDRHFQELEEVIARGDRMRLMQSDSFLIKFDLESEVHRTQLIQILELRIANDSVQIALTKALKEISAGNLMTGEKLLAEGHKNWYKSAYSKILETFIHQQQWGFELRNRLLQKNISDLKIRVEIYTIFAFVIALLFSWSVTRSLRIGLARFEHATLQVANGNFDLKLPVAQDGRSANELNLLGSAFNRMVLYLQDSKREIARQNETLFQSSKMTALGEMAASIAHEINNPIAIIKLKAEQIRDSIAAGNIEIGDVKNSIIEIDKTGDRISMIVSGLKSITRTRNDDPFEWNSIRKIIEETIVFCTEKLKSAGIDIQVKYFCEDSLLECRSTQISQVILNLLNNSYDAVKHSHEKWILLEVHSKALGLEVSVTDSGNRIPEESRPNIIRPSFTTKPGGNSIGLGLSISKRIIESHFGTFYLEGDFQYTRFVFFLPTRQEHKKETSKAA